jgi:hypothetical protein
MLLLQDLIWRIMEYIKCLWLHSFNDEPILLISEIDDERFEKRKIEIFHNGFVGFADETQHSDGTDLGKTSIPLVEEINQDKQFDASLINKKEFEDFWEKRGTRIDTTTYNSK